MTVTVTVMVTVTVTVTDFVWAGNTEHEGTVAGPPYALCSKQH